MITTLNRVLAEEQTELTSDMLQEAYAEFIKDLPKEAVKSGTLEDGTELTMYGYQFAVNILNEVIGFDHWFLVVDNDSVIVDKTADKKSAYQATVKVFLQLGNWQEGKFVPIAEKFSYGSGVHEQRANALKGAVTNGFKKAAAMFGIGKKAYEGLLEDFDIDELSGHTKETKQTRVTKVKQESVSEVTTEDLEKTKPIEVKLLNVKSKEDLTEAQTAYEKIKSELSEKQIHYLDSIVNRLIKRYE